MNIICTLLCKIQNKGCNSNKYVCDNFFCQLQILLTFFGEMLEYIPHNSIWGGIFDGLFSKMLEESPMKFEICYTKFDHGQSVVTHGTEGVRQFSYVAKLELS